MEYEWGEAKREFNKDKHGIDFTAISGFDWMDALIKPSARGEMRFAATGYIGSRLHRVIYTEREGWIRIISLRKANQREVRDYERDKPC